MKIEWTQTECGTWRGIDENSNVYLTPANRETCSVQTVDGYSGYGWTPEEALSRAKSDPPAPSLLDAAKIAVDTIEALGNAPRQTAASWWDGLAQSRLDLRAAIAAIAAEEARQPQVSPDVLLTTANLAIRQDAELSRLRAENAELRAVCKRALVWLAKAECEGINANCAMPCDLPECQNQIEAILAKKESE
jgi:hypothetical protein